MSRLHEAPMRVLIEEIVDGEPPAGELLPKEVALAERFGVSRGVVRELTRGLEERGLVTVRHGRGAIVRDPADWEVFDPAVLAALVAAPGGKRFRAEALESQRLIEPEAAALAAQRARAEQIEGLERALDTMSATAARASRGGSAAQRYRDAHLDFHRGIVRAAGNRLLARMSEPVHEALAAAGAERGDRKRRLAEHRRILAAIAAGDADGARAAMADHLDSGRSRRGR